MRLFIAIDIPKKIADALSEIQKKLPDEGVKKVKDLHLTLKFLGEVDDSRLDPIKQSLAQIKAKKFRLTLNELGVFPNTAHISVVWAGLEDDGDLYYLKQAVENAMHRLKFEKENGFEPHLTLCRIKFLKDRQKFIDVLEKIKIDKLSFDVVEFKLVKSTLTKEGPMYEVLGMYPLEDSQAVCENPAVHQIPL